MITLSCFTKNFEPSSPRRDGCDEDDDGDDDDDHGSETSRLRKLAQRRGCRRICSHMLPLVQRYSEIVMYGFYRYQC